jgi:hypothetical protein
MLFVFFWVIHLHSSYVPAYEIGTDRVFQNVFKLRMPVNHTEESIQRSEHGESMKLRIIQDVSLNISLNMAAVRMSEVLVLDCQIMLL